MLGATVANLRGLVRMSYGCGEQNMVNFAPTVFVSSYLQSVGQLTGERRRKAIDFIFQGTLDYALRNKDIFKVYTLDTEIILNEYRQ